ncbi:hypothetical protein AJ78_00674 [Emergomyces pasteurianus Ep9510]|uniref:Transcription factor Iwr1 domain-containing protein n=1 Tax=Emergomyces pasteurianus Ep9510 TaxID=1447872 RepID=A0A1J9QU52_9EURO|nr:hypothetical protein AJ78_00674 [Emergomyces pasteurianus Ep9510]
MALPPEHIRIKRRREEEPVETLYIQSQIPQPKRRYTDFFFQRVVRTTEGDVSPRIDADALPATSAKENIKCPRSVSTSNISHGVPIVRATVPGSEFENKRIMSKKEGSSGKSLMPPSSSPSSALRASHGTRKSVSPMTDHSGSSSVISSPSSVLRRFHITAPSDHFTSPSSKLLHQVSGGIQKHRGDRIMSRAVVIEKRPHLVDDERVSTVLDDLVTKIEEVKVSGEAQETPLIARREGTDPTLPELSTNPVVQRKRHVVNDAERRWKEESKASRYFDRAQQTRDNEHKAKSAQSIHEDPSLWDQDSDQLATELAEFALEITSDSKISGISPEPTPRTPPRRPGQFVGISPSKPVLKYPPRLPRVDRDSPGKSNRGIDGTGDNGDAKLITEVDLFADAASVELPQEHPEADVNGGNFVPPAKQTATFDTVSDLDSEDDKDDGYVYDEFVRRPVEEIATDPRAAHLFNGEWASERGVVPRDIGVVVITEEDIHFWEAFAESDEEGKGWDSEDGDSNAEDNPANEYPDEDLEFDDEYDDTNAAYRNYRRNASDDEEFDPDYDNYHYGCCTSNGPNSDDDY